jgi:hypothetical protein
MLIVDHDDQVHRALIECYRRTGDVRCMHMLWERVAGLMRRMDRDNYARGYGIGTLTGEAGQYHAGALYEVMIEAARKFDLGRGRWFRAYLRLELRTVATNERKVARGRQAYHCELDERTTATAETSADLDEGDLSHEAMAILEADWRVISEMSSEAFSEALEEILPVVSARVGAGAIDRLKHELWARYDALHGSMV